MPAKGTFSSFGSTILAGSIVLILYGVFHITTALVLVVAYLISFIVLLILFIYIEVQLEKRKQNKKEQSDNKK
jgi:hypothetical protein